MPRVTALTVAGYHNLGILCEQEFDRWIMRTKFSETITYEVARVSDDQESVTNLRSFVAYDEALLALDEERWAAVAKVALIWASRGPESITEAAQAVVGALQ